MKSTVANVAGYHHVSIYQLLPTALGASRAENTAKLRNWLNQIVANSPEIIGFELIQGNDSSDSANNVLMRVVYSNTDGLSKTRLNPEHQKMMAWFSQVGDSKRMNVDYWVGA